MSRGWAWGGARCLAQGAGRGDVSGRPGRAEAVAAAAAAVVVAAVLAVVAAPGRQQQQQQQQPGGGYGIRYFFKTGQLRTCYF